MPKKLPNNSNTNNDSSPSISQGKLLTIGQISKILGVSRDTLRRWEAKGKIVASRTNSNYRLYDINQILENDLNKKPRKKITAQTKPQNQFVADTTEEIEVIDLNQNPEALLNQSSFYQTSELNKRIIDLPEPISPKSDSLIPVQFSTNETTSSASSIGFGKFIVKTKSLFTASRLMLLIAMISLITVFTTAGITASYLTQPESTKSFFVSQNQSNTNKNNQTVSGRQLIATALSPFNALASEIIKNINPTIYQKYQLAKNVQPETVYGENSMVKTLEDLIVEAPITSPSGQVLADSTPSASFLDIKLDTSITGTLNVNGQGIFSTSITAPNVIYSLTAGDNITITEGQNPTISATLTQTDTLQTVTARGATTTIASVFSGGLTASSLSLTNVLNMGQLSDDPSSAVDGSIYYNTSSDEFKCYINGSWADCDTDTTSSGDITAVTVGNGLSGGGSSDAVTIDIDVTTTGTTSTTSVNSGLEATSTGLSLLRGCSDSQSLVWESSTSTWDCGSPQGVVNIKESSTTISSASTLEFLGGDFDLSESPPGTALIQLATTLTSVTGVAGNFDIAGSLVAGTANAFSVSTAGGITIPSTQTLTIGSVGLSAVGSNNLTSGATLVGVFDEFANSSATNIQDVLDDLDAAIGAGSSKWGQGSGFIYVANTTDDVIIGDSTVAAASFHFDESASTAYFGTNESANGNLTLYSSGVGITDPTLTTDSSGNLLLTSGSNNITVTSTGINNTAIGATTPLTGAFTTLSATGNVTLNDAGADNILIGAAADTVTIISNTLSLTDDNWSISAAGAAVLTSIDAGSGTIQTTGSVLANSIDRSSSGTLAIGNTTATAVSLCNSAACDTISIGTNADADSITIGDTLDSFTLASSGLNVSSAGALSGITTIVTSGTINTATISGGTLSAGTFSGGSVSGGALSGTALTGTGSFTITGGTASGETLTLVSTSHGTKGDIQFFSSANKITSAGALTIAGALNAAGITSSGTISFTGLSTNGVVYTSGGTGTLNTEAQLALSRGGTNKNITPSAGALVYSDADSFELTAVGTTGECLISNGTSAPSWTSCTAASLTPFTTGTGIIDKTTIGDRLRLQYGDAGDVQFTIENTTTATIPTADAMQIDLTGGTTGIVDDGVDGLFITAEFGNGTASTRSGLHLDINPVNSPTADDTIYGINIDGLAAGTSAVETAIAVGSNWDTVLDSANLDISGAGAISGATGIVSSGTITFSGLSTGVVINSSGTLSSEAQLAVARGGTGAASFTAGGILYGNGSSAIAASAQGTTGQAVLSGGSGSPTFTTGTLTLAGNFATSGSSALTLTTTGSTNVTLPTTGTLITNTASANQTITSTQTSGTVFSIADATNITGATVGQSISLTGTGAFDQTGLQIVLSGASGSNLNALVVNDGTNNTATLSKLGVLTLGASGANTGQLVFTNSTDTDTTVFQASTSQSQATVTYTLPVNDGDSNQVLTSNGSGSLSWQSVTGIGAGTGTITAVGNITSGAAFTGADLGNDLIFEGSTSTDNAFEITLTASDPAADRTYTLPDLGTNGTFAFLQGTQTFSGAKSFTGGVTLGAASSNTGTLTFGHASHAFTTVFQPSASQSQNNTFTLPVDDGSSNYVLATDGSGVLSWQSVAGVGAGTGDITAVGSMYTGDVFGDSSADDDCFGLTGLAGCDANTGRIVFDDQTIDEINLMSANVGIGTATPTAPLNVNNGTFTVTADASQAVVDISGALTEAGSGTHARLVGVSITAPTITAGAGAVTNTASLYIAGAPSASGATNYALWVDAGNVRFDGTIQAGSGNEVLTLSTGKIDADAIGLMSATNGVGSTSSASGLESVNDTLTLLQGCADTDTLAWDETSDVWSCSTPTTAVVTISEGATQYTNQNELNFNEYDFGVQDSGSSSIVTVDYTNFGSRTNPFNIGDALAGGAAGAARTIDIGGVDTDLSNTINLATEATTADVITIGNSNASTTLALTGGNDWSITTAGLATFAANVNANGGLDVDDAFVVADGGVLTTSQAANLNAGFDVDDVFVVADGGVVTANTDVNFTFAGAEDFAITSDLATAGTLNVTSIVGTPSSTNGTIRGLLIQQASSANTNGLDTGLLIDNADDSVAITDAIKLTNSGGGGYTNLLETPSIDISGAGVISGATGLSSSGTIAFSGLSTNGVVYTSGGTGTLNTEAQLAASRGGTGINTSASTGVPSISGGTWSVNALLPLTLGGTNKNLTAVAGGVVYTDADSLEVTSAGSAGQCLVSNGTSAPSWDVCDSSATTPFTTAGGIIDKTTVGDRLRLMYGDAGDVQFTIENTTNSTIPAADAAQINLTGGTTGIITDGVDGLFIGAEFGNGTTNTNSGLHIDIDPVNTPSGDEVFNGILIDALAAGTSASENAIQIGANWDKILDTPSIDISGAGAISGATGVSSSGTITFSGLSSGVVISSSGTLSSEAQLAIARGGTNGTATPTGGAIAYGTGSAYAFSSAGSSGQALVSGGGGSPTWTTGTLTLAGNFATSGTSTLTLTTTGTTTATLPSGTITLADLQSSQTFTGAKTFDTTTTLTYAGTENLSITSDLAGDVNVISITGTPSSTSGTTRGFALSQANSANSNGLDTGFYINNLDTDLAIGTAIQIANTGGGGYTNFLDTASIDITGAGAITGATGFNGLVVTANNGTITNGTWNGSAVGVAYGGTGVTTFGGTNTILYTSSADTLAAISAGTANQVLRIPSGGGAPAFGQINLAAAAAVTGTLSAANGGTGVDGSAASNGQLLIGNGSGFTLATATAGNGISWTNGSGSIQPNLSSLTSDWNQSGAFDIVLDSASSELKIKSADGASFYATLDVETLTQNRTYILPSYAAATPAEFCLDTGNCSGLGGSIAGAGNAGQIAYFTDSSTISSDSVFNIDGTNHRLGINTATPATVLNVFGESEVALFDPATVVVDADMNSSPTIRLRGTYDADGNNTVSSANQSFDLRTIPVSGGASPVSRFAIANVNNAGTSAEVFSILNSGFVGIGDTTPTALFTVGSGDLFQVNSSGAIAAVTGYTQASGTFSLTAADASLIDLSSINHSTTSVEGLRLPSNTTLSTTGPTGGVDGFLAYDSDDDLVKVWDGDSWENISGASTSLQQAYDNDADGSNAIIALSSADDSLIFRNPSSSGTDSSYVLTLDQLNTGAVDTLVLNNAGTGALINGTSSNSTGTKTNGILIDQSGAGTMTNGLNITNSAGTLTNGITIGSGSQTIGTGLNLASTGLTTDISLQNGETIDNDTDGTINLAVGGTSALKVGSTGISSIGNVAHSIVNSGGALNIDSNSTGAINIGTSANAKTITIGNGTGASALAFTSGTGSQTFTSSVATTSTTSSAWVFTGNSLSSGTGMYASSTSLTTGKLAQYSLPQNNFSSGTIMDLRTTSTGLTGAAGTGSLLNLDWSPGSATTATGDLFSLNIGANGSTTGSLFNILDSGASIFSISEVQVATSLPANFTAPGDVSIAYDIQFTNPTASYIKSYSALTIQPGDPFGSSNLTLAPYNEGSVYIPSNVTTSSGVEVEANLLTTGAAVDISSTSTAGTALGNSFLLTLDRSGTNAASTHVAYGITSSVRNTGTNSINIASAFTATGAVTNYAIATGTISSASSGTNYQLNTGTITSSTGATSASINTGAISGVAGTVTYGINLGANSAIATTNYGINIGAVSGGGTTNYGINLGIVSGATTNQAINISGVGTGGTGLNFSSSALTTGSAVSLTVDGLTSGKAINIASAATAFTGSLFDITLSGSNAANTGPLLQLTNSGTSNTNTAFYLKHYATGSNNLALRVDDVSGDTTPFVIDGTGQVGIGTSAPGAMLNVISDVASDYAAEIFADGNNSNRWGMLVQSGADDASGTNVLIDFKDGDGGALGGISYTGTTTSYATSSDVRLKDNIQTSNKGLAALMNINVRDYTFKAENGTGNEGKIHTGFIAQDLINIFPDAVIVPNDANQFWSVDYGKVTPLIVKSVQELNQKVENALLTINGDGGASIPAELKADKLVIGSKATVNGFVEAENYSLNADSINRVGALASIPVDTNNKVTVSDAINLLAENINSLEQQSASRAAELAEAKQLGQQAVAQTEVLGESVASASASIASLDQKIKDLLASYGSDTNSSATDSATIATNTDTQSPELTPPSILFATGSATLADLTVENDATISGSLQTLNITISDTLKSLGQSFFGTTSVAGDLTVNGTLSITEDNTINGLGTLRFQTSPLADAVEFFNGIVGITKDGVLTAKEIVIDQITVKADQSAGTEILTKGQTEIAVFNPLVKSDSIIVLTPETLTNEQLVVTDKVDGSGFVVKVKNADSTQDIKFSYLIVGQK